MPEPIPAIIPAAGDPVPTVTPEVTPQVTPQVAPSWRDTLPDDLKNDKSLATIADVPHLAKQYVEAQRYNVGALKMPSANATPEEVAAFHKKLGRPDSPEGYTLMPPTLPEGIEWDKALESDFRAVAHRLGLTSPQVQGLVEFEGRRTLTGLQTRTQEAQAVITALQAEWGPSYEPNLEVAGRAVRHLGGDDLAKALNRTGAGNDPAIIRAFVRAGKMLVEDGAISGEVEGHPSSSDARAQANEIMADTKGPYWNKADPRHADTVKKVQALFQLAFPPNP